MKEEILREIVRNWLDEQYANWKKHMNFEIFHGKGPLTNHLRRKFQGLDLTSIPNYNSASIEPDIAGIIISLKTEQKLWVYCRGQGK